MISGILGNYRIESFINKGGMGTVYKAYDVAMDRYVALKALPPELFENEIARERFRREAHAIARLEHDHILPVIAYGEERNLAYIVMRYMPGGSLSDKLKNGRLPLHEVSHLLGQVADALDYAHENGIVHR
ncbi:MAG: serine/threonine protein kinase, partial [Chitinophagaceae bacterium]|nr:serine/threonine protein kinase [Anaerolineae bacterium]